MLIISKYIILINRRQNSQLHIKNSAMTYDHLEEIINILKNNHRFISVVFHCEVNTNIDTSGARWRELQVYYKPGDLRIFIH